MDISSISSIAANGIQGTTKSVSTGVSKPNDLGKTFDQVLNSLNESQQNADSLITQLASGQDVDVADVMIATTENDVNFRVAMAIRDRLVDAYREIMRMSV